MRCLGTTNGWLFFEHAQHVVAVDSETNDTTDLIDGDAAATIIASAADEEWRAPNDGPDLDVARMLAESVFTDGLDPHPSLPLTAAAPKKSYSIPASVSAAARRGLKWRKTHNRGGTDVGVATARLLAGGGNASLEKVRHIARYWARHEVDKKAKGWKQGEDGFPSAGRIAWELWGGEAGKQWSQSIVKRTTTAALIAAAYDPDANVDDSDPETDGEFNDPEKTHRFTPTLGAPSTCRYCGKTENDEIHDITAADYSVEEADPDSVHFFTEDPEDAEKCEICGRASDDVIHKQAALAQYYEFKSEYDKIYGENADYWTKKNAAAQGVSAAAAVFGVDWVEDDEDPLEAVFERSAQAQDDTDMLFWERRGNEDEDPLTYFVSHVEGDTMTANQIYVFDGNDFYLLDVEQRAWVETPLPQGATVYALDDETARDVIRAFLFSGAPFDMRECDPGEAELMATCMPHLDYEMLDRALMSAGEPVSTGDRVEFPDDGYTPQERSRNAQRQVRDSTGRFSPGGGPGGTDTEPPADRKAVLPSAKTPLTQEEITAIFDTFAEYVAARREQSQEMAEETGEPITDPSQSDVDPIKLALVDRGDQNAILDLALLVPASTQSVAPKLFRRVAGGQWEEDVAMLRSLQGIDPPPVVTLEGVEYEDVLAQVDSFYEQEGEEPPAEDTASLYGLYGELVAAGIPGIADTPSDIAAVERLKKYWTVGKGGLVKIRWNTPGDWTRCNRQLRKYMGPRAKGYCANLHKLMTGVWPGDRRNIGRRRRGRIGSIGDVYDVIPSDMVIALTAAAAQAEVEITGEVVPEDVQEVKHGSRFRIPVLAPVGVKSGDGRSFREGALSYRDLPIPLMWQIQTQEGHNSSVIVGRIDSVEQDEDSALKNARGVFDIGPYGREAERLVDGRFLRGVSVDLDEFEARAMGGEEIEEDDTEAGTKISQDPLDVTKGRVIAATLVAKPAFQECTIEIETEEPAMVADGVYIGSPSTTEEFQDMVLSAVTAAGIPVNPPDEWFANPNLSGKTPLTVESDGRVYGHIATWDVDHIGLPFSTRPPRSRSDYAYFHTGLLQTASGVDIPVGQITLAGGHADLKADAAAAARHYDDTGSAFADVHAGEDQHGIWVAGALRPTVTPEQVRAIRASAPSGDWRPINGRLELVAVCQVNVPGFPITRARVASGQVFALVAAGTSFLAEERAKHTDTSGLDALATRISALEGKDRAALDQAREAALTRVNVVRDERAAALKAKMSALHDRVFTVEQGEAEIFRDYSQEKRDEYAKKGWALPDGSYPIANVGDLKNAIRAYGRASEDDRAKVRRHIRKRARALGETDLIPESWKSAGLEQADLLDDWEDVVVRFAMTAASGRYPDGSPWDPDRHPRDAQGRFRRAVARIKKAAQEAREEEIEDAAERAEDAERRGDIDAAQEAAEDVLEAVDEEADDIADIDTADELREANRDLGSAVANLPIEMGDLNKKFKFSELPEDLQGLITDLLTRVESRLSDEHAAKAGSTIKGFIEGVDVLSQPEISAELTRMLRYLI